MNDCKSKIFWSAIICLYKQLQVYFILFYFWSAIVRMHEQLQAMSYFIFGVRSEGMDRWSWSDAPHKNHLVIQTRLLTWILTQHQWIHQIQFYIIIMASTGMMCRYMHLVKLSPIGRAHRRPLQ